MTVATLPAVEGKLAAASALPIAPSEPIFRLSVDQYHAMIQSGILTTDDHVELLEGWLVLEMSKNPPHTLAVGLLLDAIRALLASGWFVNVQEPITTTDSEPEPDLVVVRGERRQFRDRHPAPEDVALVVEVADATLHRDRTVKRRLYAAASVPVYWIVSLPDRRIEVHSDPSGPDASPDYRQRLDFGPEDEVGVVIEDSEIGRIAVREVLP